MAAKMTVGPQDDSPQAKFEFDNIADLDRRLIALLQQRAVLVRSQVHAGSLSALDLVDAVGSSIQTAGEPSTGEPIPADRALTWLRHAASICGRAAGLREPIAFLGPIYSYSYLAAVKHFGLAAELVPVTTIAAVFEELVRGQARYGVVPIENSTDGRVVDTLGMFAKFPIEICGEVLLPIHHCLLGKCVRADIVEVQSKPQALSQCRNWLAQHLPDARLVEVASTTAAAAAAATAPGVAAIASREAGIHQALTVIDENIEDNQQNVTRFAVIGQRLSGSTGRDKTSLMFQLEHRPGALADAMLAFQKANLNLTWIESFPLPNRPNEYLFFVELEGHRCDTTVGAAILQLGQLTSRLEVLGSYPRGSV
jgi:chorismate mutase/prephenate dehydratase